MPVDDTVLYEDFVRAREEAVALTDRYRNSPPDAPNRDQLWHRVVVQTETARLLLVTWLRRQRPEKDAEDGANGRPLESLIGAAAPGHRYVW